MNNNDINNIYDDYINDLIKSSNNKEEFKEKLRKLPLEVLEFILNLENHKLKSLRKQIIEKENNEDEGSREFY